MSYKDILVHVDSTTASRDRLKLALSVARRFDARLLGLHVVPEPEVPPYFKPSQVERIAAVYAENARDAADIAEALFREETRDAAATSWDCIAGDMAQTIAEHARVADLLVLGQFDTENPPAISAFLLPAKVVFDAASPILVVPNAGKSRDVGKRIVAAWDGGREAARAIRDAMPLLEDAEQVSILANDGANALALAAHLGRHGVRAQVTEIPPSEKTVTDTLLAHAAEFGADLLVIGAYAHSRIWEFLVGGTTQDLLERTMIPVLISR